MEDERDGEQGGETERERKRKREKRGKGGGEGKVLAEEEAAT